MRWEITGADKQSGSDTRVIIEADTEDSARRRANRRGVLVSDVRALDEDDSVAGLAVSGGRAVTPVASRPVQTVPFPPAPAPAPAHAQQINVGVAVQQQQPKGVSGFGIAALVLGIMAALVCWVPFVGLLTIPVALIGLLLAGVGLIVSLAGRRSGVGMPVAGGAVCGLALVIAIMSTGTVAGVATGAVGESFSRARETSNRVRCASHMRQIGQALLLYANDHGMAYPPTLAALKGREVPDDVFACPSGGTANYVYLPDAPAPDAPASEKAIVLYEPLSNHQGDGANFLHGDGSVSWESGADAQKLVAGR